MKLMIRIHFLPLVAAICFCAVVAVSATAQTKPAAPKVRSELIVSTDWLAKNLSNKNVFVLHVTSNQKTYEAGHIPGARFLNMGELLATREGLANELPPVEQLQKVFEATGIGNEGKIVLYGDNNGLAAARAFFTLDYLGHGNRAALLDGVLE